MYEKEIGNRKTTETLEAMRIFGPHVYARKASCYFKKAKIMNSFKRRDSSSLLFLHLSKVCVLHSRIAHIGKELLYLWPAKLKVLEGLKVHHPYDLGNL